MSQYINKDAVVTEIERLISNGQVKLQESEERKDYESYICWAEHIATCINILSFINNLEVKDIDIDVSKISENLAEAYEYLGYTQTSNLAHNKPMVSARLKWAIQSLFDAGMFELTHDKKYRMESLGLKTQKGE